MGIEIERKFLVVGEVPDGESSEICQAYLCADIERTIRVRIDDQVATLTIKGKTEGLSRSEYEYEIPLEDARELMELALGQPVRKTRTRIPHGNHVWEVDVFHDANEGLCVAEVELAAEDEVVELPDWVGDEVSGDGRYRNSYLAKHPYSEWGE
ncbi:adenylate cyclase [bacterium E08(2017)]|nr:adenylate cyclase [bacterium E08(2017)]